jgi:preprotein translocase subunit YajC
MLALLAGGMYFLMIRPAKRQQQAQQKLMDSLEVGSRVMLTSGVFGSIRHLGDRQAIIEISPGVDLTVLRRAIAKAVAPDEEEFEYADSNEVNDPPRDEAADAAAWELLSAAAADPVAAVDEAAEATEQPSANDSDRD